VLLAILLTGATGCSADPAEPTDAAPGAGSYPVATAGPMVTAVPTATLGGYQLVAAGEPVLVELPGAELEATTSGPDVTLPVPSPGQPITAESAPGVLTVSLSAVSGSADVLASSFLGLDEKRDPISLQSDVDHVAVSPGHPAVVHLSAQFASGHTTLTWQPTGPPQVTWDFVVEID
jgi:hypothetical protein